MKTFSVKIDPLTNETYYEVHLRGQQLLGDALLNKGSAFDEEERMALGLKGILRSSINTLEQQIDRCMEAYERKHDDLERYIYLQGLLNRSETLFYAVLLGNLERMLPIVYTPVVGQACLQMSHITRRYRGVYIDPENVHMIDQILSGLTRPEQFLVVVTDGERILGLGDLGSDGMGIPVGKINLYVAAGGLHPACCLPVTLDVGTNNQRLLDDPMYLGYRRPRLTGPAYEELVERFVLGVKRNFPNALLQWEDFAKHHAFKLQARYRERILSFNDDIQGTGAVALASLISAMKIKGERFRDQRFVIAGMGQAGVGIARNIAAAIRDEGGDLDDIRRCLFAYDLPGLVTDDLPDLDDPQRPFAQPRAVMDGWRLESPGKVTLLDVVRNVKATVLIGVTARGGLFSQPVLAELARNAARPVVMALSNPTSKAECTPTDVAQATRGLGLVATGSPFDPVCFEGRTVRSSQCNNLYMFPGVGLGALVARATRVTDQMFLAASRAVAAMVSPQNLADGLLLPPMVDIREVAFRVAFAVARQARDGGFGRQMDDEHMALAIRRAQWSPRYYPYRPGAMPDERLQRDSQLL